MHVVDCELLGGHSRMRALFPGRDEEGVKRGQFTDTTQFRQSGDPLLLALRHLVGFTGCAPAGDAGTDTGLLLPQGKTGEWQNRACMNNCSCGSSRCLLEVYVEDGVPLKVRTDEQDGRHHRGAAASSLPARTCPDQQHHLAGAHQAPDEAQGLES